MLRFLSSKIIFFWMKSTACAHSNIAIIKYWGNLVDEERIPLNPSISLTISPLTTKTTVRWGSRTYRVKLDGKTVKGDGKDRIVRNLERIRKLANFDGKAEVVSINSFPSGTGLASSASGFAALALASSKALGMKLSRRELSILARYGSGSAARSIYGGWSELTAGETSQESYAFQLAPESHWQIHDIIILVSKKEKTVSSEDGHKLAKTSDFLSSRIKSVRRNLPLLRSAIITRDFDLLGKIAEKDSLSMHSIMLTSDPSLIYLEPETVEIMKRVKEWRPWIKAYFTIDAGPNVHLLTIPHHREKLLRKILKIYDENQLIECVPGRGAWTSKKHLF
jgi:diphosphomevalonate decarboxylase